MRATVLVVILVTFSFVYPSNANGPSLQDTIRIMRDAMFREEKPDADTFRRQLLQIDDVDPDKSRISRKTTETVDFAAIVSEIVSSSYIEPCLSQAGLWNMFVCELDANAELLESLSSKRNGDWTDVQLVTYMGVRLCVFTIFYTVQMGYKYGTSLSSVTDEV